MGDMSSTRAGTARQLRGAIEMRGRTLTCLGSSLPIGEERIRMILLKPRASSRNMALVTTRTHTDLIHQRGWQCMGACSIWILMMGEEGWHLLWKTIRQCFLSSDLAVRHSRFSNMLSMILFSGKIDIMQYPKSNTRMGRLVGATRLCIFRSSSPGRKPPNATPGIYACCAGTSSSPPPCQRATGGRCGRGSIAYVCEGETQDDVKRRKMWSIPTWKT